MKILLTGNAGFIGSALFKALSLNHQVTGIDKANGWDRDILNNSQDLLTCDFPNTEFDLIIHLAGKSGVRESFTDPAGYWNNNIEASRRLFERYPDTRILYASSSSAYEPDLNPYAASKFVLEELAERFNITRTRVVTTETAREDGSVDVNIRLEAEESSAPHLTLIEGNKTDGNIYTLKPKDKPKDKPRDPSKP